MEQSWFPKIPPAVIAALAWIVFLLLVLLYAGKMGRYPVTAIDLTHRLQAPLGFGGDISHLLGTDVLGRDIWSRVLHGMRVSLEIAMGAALMSLIIGTTLGLLAAHMRGVVEQVVLMLIDFQASMPFLIIALALLAFLGQSLTLFAVLMGFYGWERHARIARTLAISAMADGYITAIRQLGAGTLRIYFLHVLPNIASSLIVSSSLSFPEIVLMESGLSFLGLGVQVPLVSLGSLIGAGRAYIVGAPWLVIAPAVAIVLTTLAFSLVGDWLRDRLDPTLR